MEAAQKEAIKNRDYTVLQIANKEVTESFKPIISTIEEKKEKLNLELEEILSEKQLKKWKKYNASNKKK
jgi:ferredoxin-fold anticodon binding domain-containing protein